MNLWVDDVRSKPEEDGKLRELKEMLREAKDALLYMLILHKAQDPRCNQEKILPALFILQSEPDQWTPERADEVFKKIFDYLEQEESNRSLYSAHEPKPRCGRCVYELSCSKDKDKERKCPDYKRDAPDGGYYG